MPSTQGPSAASRWIRWFAVGCVWFTGIVGGLVLLARHDTVAGVDGQAPSTWPHQTRIPLNASGHTLVMFAHPRCPCTRASLGELAEMLARCPGTVTAHVVFFKPFGTADAWVQTDQWSSASEIPGVQVICDVDGSEAHLFHAATSGQTLLYNAAGELEFNGGITIARGHAGDNEGRHAIESLVTHSIPQVRMTPVYGCPVVQPK